MYPYSAISKLVFFSVFFFQALSSSLVWLPLDFDKPSCGFSFILLNVLWASWTYVFMPFIDFLMLYFIIASNTPSSPFLLLQLFRLCTCYTVWNCTRVLWCSDIYFILFSLSISVWRWLLMSLQTHWFFLWLCQVYSCAHQGQSKFLLQCFDF